MFPLPIREKYDVVVVGAGPGGTWAALHAKKNGAPNVLLVDKRQEIGTPVRCGEGLSISWFKLLGIKTLPKYCVQRINGAVVYAPNGKNVRIKVKEWGYILERKMFEKHLAEQAAKAGVQIIVRTQATGVLKKNGKTAGVVLESYGQKKQVKADIVIAADGVESQIAQLAGLKTKLAIDDADSGFEYEMTGLKLNDPHEIEMHMGTKIAPRGYVWVFPKGENTANVGIGIHPEKGKTAKDHLDEFIQKNPERFKNASIIEAKAGVIPLGGFEGDVLVGDGLLVVGDAARMVNPLHGGGIGEAMEAGMLAGKIAAKAVKKKDYGKKTLSEYENEWRKKRGKILSRVLRVRKFVESLSDEDMNEMAEVVKGEELIRLVSGLKIVGLGLRLLKKRPSVTKKLIKLVK